MAVGRREKRRIAGAAKDLVIKLRTLTLTFDPRAKTMVVVGGSRRELAAEQSMAGLTQTRLVENR